MSVQDWVAVIGLAVVLIGVFIKLPTMIEGAVTKHLANYPTRLEAHEAYIRRTEYEKREAEINRELRFMHRLIMAIARKVGVDADVFHDPSDDG